MARTGESWRDQGLSFWPEVRNVASGQFKA